MFLKYLTYLTNLSAKLMLDLYMMHSPKIGRPNETTNNHDNRSRVARHKRVVPRLSGAFENHPDEICTHRYIQLHLQAVEGHRLSSQPDISARQVGGRARIGICCGFGE